MNTDLPPRRPRRLWPWALGLVAVLVLAAVAGGLWALHHLAGLVHHGVQVVVDGSDWGRWGDWDQWEHIVLNPDAWQLSFGGVLLLLAVVAVLLVVVLPLVVGLVLTCVGLALAIALLAAVVSVAAALSPLLLVALLLWLALREKPAKQFKAAAGQQGQHGSSTAGTASMAP